MKNRKSSRMTHMTQMTLQNRRKQQFGQGMIEYGLILGLISVYVLMMFLALKPIFVQQMNGNQLLRLSGEGRVAVATQMGMKTAATSGAIVAAGGLDDF